MLAMTCYYLLDLIVFSTTFFIHGWLKASWAEGRSSGAFFSIIPIKFLQSDDTFVQMFPESKQNYLWKRLITWARFTWLHTRYPLWKEGSRISSWRGLHLPTRCHTFRYSSCTKLQERCNMACPAWLWGFSQASFWLRYRNRWFWLYQSLARTTYFQAWGLDGQYPFYASKWESKEFVSLFWQNFTLWVVWLRFF